MEEESNLSKQNVICPKCKYTPKDKDDDLIALGVCPACGIIIDKYLKFQKKRKEGQSFVIHGDLKDKEKSKELTKISLALICFAIVCLISSWVINWNRGSTGRKQLPPEGGIVGPIKVPKNRAVYQISVSQDIRQSNDWSFVTGEVLDKDKEYLFSFGKEFWKESGYDSDGRWTEKKTKYDMKVTLERGTYYLNFESQRPRGGRVQNNIWVIVKRKGGSALPLFISGVMALIIGVILNEIANRTMTKIISEMAEAAGD